MNERPAGALGALSFLGREEQLRDVAAFLVTDQSVSLVGLPGMGKTSLLRALAQPGSLRQLYPDAQILIACLNCAGLQHSTREEVFGRFATALSQALEVNAWPAEPAVTAAAALPSRMAFEAALRRLNGCGLQVVVSLDHFDVLCGNAGLGAPFFNALRAAAGRFKLAFLTASRQSLADLTEGQWVRELLSSPFFNIFATISLGPLSEASARRLLRETVSTSGAERDSALEDTLYALVGGYPPGLALARLGAAACPGDTDGLARFAERSLRPWYEAIWQHLLVSEQQFLRGQGTDHGTDRVDRVLVQALARKGLLIMESGERRRAMSSTWQRYVLESAVLGDA